MGVKSNGIFKYLFGLCELFDLFFIGNDGTFGGKQEYGSSRTSEIGR